MKHILPDEYLMCDATDSSASAHPEMARRSFLQRAAMASVGFGLVLSAKNTLAQYSEEDVWRAIVGGLVYTIAGCQQVAAYIISRLNRSPLSRTSSAGDLHDYFRPPFVFGRPPIDPQRVICDNGFEVNRFPFYDAEYPCRNFSDLNAPEILTVTNPHEIRRFDCVLTPDGPRTQLERGDHAKYHDLAEHYDINPREWELPSYKRRLIGHGKAHTGYHIIHKTEIRSGKPRTEFIVSKDI